jgi:hypothetical protein
VSRRIVVAVCCTFSSVLLVTAPAQAAQRHRITARERAEAQQLLAPMKEFKAAADARHAELTAAMAAAEEEARRCPPPRGVPSATPRTKEGFGRVFTAFFADYYHRSVAGLGAVRSELEAASARYRALRPRLHTRDFRTLAGDEARDLDAAAHSAMFDLCAFWAAWEGEGLDPDKGLIRLEHLVSGGRSSGAWHVPAMTHLVRVAGSKALDAWLGFPVEGRYAPKPFREALATVDHEYDDFFERLFGDFD